ncbi:MAG: pirin family protein [Azospirillaceae bacterium]
MTAAPVTPSTPGTPGTEATAPRRVAKVVAGMPASDGAGVRLKRIVGQPGLDSVGPFLMLDEFGSESADDYIAGFPDHPHRGFETITYMIEGRMRHRDNKGNEGVVGPGGVQWMTTGSGIVHSEMPEQKEGRMRGMQLWLNLPAAHKMQPASWKDFQAGDIPERTDADGVHVRAVAGTLDGLDGAVPEGPVDPVIGEIALPAGTERLLALPAGHAAFVYVLDGAATIGDDARRVEAGHAAVLSDGDAVALVAAAGETTRLFVVAGRPIDEPVARYGPFVMTTREELMQAARDFQAGRF